MADSCRKMLAKRWQSGSMMVMVDDIESAADAPTPTGKEWHSSLVASAHHHRPRTPTYLPLPCRCGLPHWRLSTACTPTDALPPAGVLYKCHPQQPGDGGSAPALTYMRVSNFGRFFDVQGGGRLICKLLAHSATSLNSLLWSLKYFGEAVLRPLVCCTWCNCPPP